MRSRNKNHKVLCIPFYFRPTFRGRATSWSQALFGALFKKINISLTIPKHGHDAKENYQFPRNQCIACNDIFHHRNHPLLLFGSSQEAEKIPLNFRNLIGITLNADNTYPKNICLPCKFKLESAVGFKNLSVTSREAEEGNLSHVKRGRSSEAESSSPPSKRMPSAASDNSGSK